ncbi:hypothetical protein BWD42_07570 [Sphingobacterium sp. CZ-UAM]|uniref:glycoside hydrolase family 18 n=1 Tax=Sphingobacterium sp. CZ-UAM TaxID=1933868 RepID=UPI00098794ED|nr:glycoside hydrolase family 18 [Sphingobacterium sp. CZ-UAM]OOG19751.1 hypothetical protein BWD42_07570 [Sphingobacterium sp. CZ-UAM]
MIHKIIYTISALFILLALTSCSKQTEPLTFKELQPFVGSEAYYEALRTYKKSDHAICFGYWGRSGANTLGPDMAYRFEGLPDSMDLVSLWGGIPKGSAWEEMQMVRKKKGTKFVWCMFGSGTEKLLRKNFPELAKKDLMLAIDSLVISMKDTIEKYQIDGFDLDYEPGYGDNSIFGDEGQSGETTDDAHTQRLFAGLSKYLGPKSNTDKILMIDGQTDLGIAPYINYFAQQSYKQNTNAALQYRFDTFAVGTMPSKKFIVLENMQELGRTGRSFMRDSQDVGSVLGMAYWNPKEGRKGGFGAYIIETDAPPDGTGQTFPTLRKGIQIQNPAPKN